MGKFLMKPKVDFAFKALMEDEKTRIGFLSAVLGMEPEDIRETRMMNTYLQKVHEADKQGILDVRIELNDNTEIDVEIQLAEYRSWAARSLFYVSKMYTDQIGESQDYSLLKRCIGISILNFNLFKGRKAFYSRFHIWEDTEHDVLYTDQMEFYTIELPKLPAELKDGDAILMWAKFINAEHEEEFRNLEGRDEYMDSALRQLEVISQNPDMRMEYEARQKAIRDHNQLMKESEQRGIEIGEQRGIEIGERRGELRGKEETARNLLKMGLSVEQIAKATGLTVEQVEALQSATETAP